MISKFLQFIENEGLIKEREKVLVAVSGGADSVALCYLMKRSGYSIGIAHCNFQLRAEESEEDEGFVEQLAEQLKIPFYSTRFNTLQLAEEKSESIQVLARNLRYEWLEHIRQLHSYNWIATGHHLNDALETFIYNFAKGTGLKGLRGIPVKNGKIIRPLLFAKRDDINQYIKEHQISFREDSSNASDKYSRNKIRHHIIPVLKTLNPSLEETGFKTLKHLKENYDIYLSGIQYWKSRIIEEQEEMTKLKLKELLLSPAIGTVLYECISPFGFNSDQGEQLLACIKKQQVGAQFYSSSHQILLDRSYILIKPIEKRREESAYEIQKLVPIFSFNGNTLSFAQVDLFPESFKIPSNSAFLDLEKIKFPLLLRHWKEGDNFQPLGMDGKKQKLQDFFSNQKLSRFEKEAVWILETADQKICWVVGFRIDERFKLDASTKKVLKLQYKSS